MPATTVPGPLDGADFRGKTRSFTVLPGGKGWPTCKACGSSLYGRRERVYQRTIGGRRMSVEVFRGVAAGGLPRHRGLRRLPDLVTIAAERRQASRAPSNRRTR
jgi:hypothetical protein